MMVENQLVQDKHKVVSFQATLFVGNMCARINRCSSFNGTSVDRSPAGGTS
jgi:hypothetical protein